MFVLSLVAWLRQTSRESGRNLKKKPSKELIRMVDIFDRTHPAYQTHKLKKRLLKEGYKQHACESCGLTEWMSNPIPLELHHRNGIKSDNSFENIELLCPNCHALTDNYRAKNIKNLSARLETTDVEPLKFGETLSSSS